MRLIKTAPSLAHTLCGLSQVQQTLEARAATFVGPPPQAFVGPGKDKCSHDKSVTIQ